MNEDYLVWGIALLAGGLLLVFLEVLVPSAGMIALTSIGLMIAGIVCLFQADVWWGVAGILCVMVLGPLALASAFKMLPNTPIGRKMMFGSSGKEQPVLGDPDDPDVMATGLEPLIGQEGDAITDLRPVGTIRVGDAKHDAVAETGYVRAGSRVRVTGIVGGELRVRGV